MRHIILGLIAAIVNIAPAGADEPPGWYIGAAASLSYMDKYDIVIPQDPSNSARLSTSRGSRIGAELGYHWTPYVRTSVEGFFEQYKSKRWDNISTGSASGLESQVNGGVMANLYLDMPNSSRFTPYVGGGIGMLHLRTPVVWTSNNLRLIDWTTAYQVMAGTSYHLAGPLHGAGSAEMYAGYRFVKSIEDATNNCRCGGATAEYDYKSHSADLGIRYNF